jgi:hypothetical protein
MALLAAVPVHAKEGLSLGVNLLFNDPGGDISNLDSGNGFGLRAGIGLNRYLSFVAAVFKTDHNIKDGSGTADLKGGTIDAKLNFPLTGSHISPYIQGGVGSYKLEYPAKTYDGTGGQLAIGIDIELFPELDFNVGLGRRNITFDATATNPEFKGRVTTLDFGFTYTFL